MVTLFFSVKKNHTFARGEGFGYGNMHNGCGRDGFGCEDGEGHGDGYYNGCADGGGLGLGGIIYHDEPYSDKHTWSALC